MTPTDPKALRACVEAAHRDGANLMAVSPQAVLALLDRLERAERDHDDARTDAASMCGDLSRCSEVLGVEQWAEMPAAIARLVERAETAEREVARLRRVEEAAKELVEMSKPGMPTLRDVAFDALRAALNGGDHE
jgi:hypothetical protein